MPFEKREGTWYYVPANRQGLTFTYTPEEKAAQKALKKEAPDLACLDQTIELLRLTFALQEDRLLRSAGFERRGKGPFRKEFPWDDSASGRMISAIYDSMDVLHSGDEPHVFPMGGNDVPGFFGERN